MSITNLVRDYGVDPSIVRMQTNDTYTTMTTPGYLSSQEQLAAIQKLNGGPFIWAPSDMILCYYLGQWAFFTTSPDAGSLVPFEVAIGVTEQEVQQSAFNHGIDTGTANAYAVALTPAVTAYTDGLLLSFTPEHNNTTQSPTVSLNGLTPVNITSSSGAVAIGDLYSGEVSFLIYSAAANAFILLNPATFSGVTPVQVQLAVFNGGADIGTADNYAVDLSPVLGAYAVGLFIEFVAANTNLTNAPTLNIDGIGPIDIVLVDGVTTPAVGDIVAGNTYFFYYTSNSVFILMNPTLSSVVGNDVQNNYFNNGADSGVADAYVVTLNNVNLANYTPLTGALVCFNAGHANLTTTPTLAVNGYAPATITNVFGGALVVNDIGGGNICFWENGSGTWLLLNPKVSGALPAFPLALTKGGTNASLTANDGGIFYSTASAGAILAGTATARQMLQSGSSTTPAWSTTTYPATNAVNTLLYASSANVMAALATANDGVLVTSNAGVPSWLANSGTAGYVLTANTGAPPSWQAASAGVTSTQVQQAAFNLGIESGSATAYVVTLSPAVASYTDGLIVMFKPIHANTTLSPTLNVNGVGAEPIISHYAINPANGNQVVAVDDLNPAQTAICIWDAATAAFILQNPYTQIPKGIVGGGYISATDAGTANAYAGYSSITSTSYTQYPAGSTFIMYSILNTNTGASTIDFGLGTNPAIVTPNGSALVGGEMVATNTYYFIRNSNSQMILLNSSLTPASNKAPTIQKFTSGSGTYTKPTGVSAILVQLVSGGGGGGGAAAGGLSAGSGGCGGGFSQILIANPSATYSYTVGAGGAGGLATPTNGSGGNQSLFSSILTCDGGDGGLASGTAAGATLTITANPVPGGGLTAGGDLNINGGSGAPGMVQNPYAYEGTGGACFFGMVGTSGYGPGAGGNGGASNGAGAGGAAGNDGILMIFEYY